MIRTALAILIWSSFCFGQDSQGVNAPDSAGSFRVSVGSSFSASAAASPRKPKLSAPLRLIADDFNEALGIIEGNHASTRNSDPSRRFSTSVNGMLNELDPHSSYFTQRQFQELNDDHRGRYFGIGATIADFSRAGRSGVYVLSVKKASPAELAGLRFGDQILEVDGINVRELDSAAVRNHLRGPNGTFITISIERWGVSEPITLKARRAKVDEPSIPVSFIVADGIGYIALTEGFHYSTAAEFDAALRKLHVEGLRSLIVDLRGNGGGLMEQAIRIAETFLPAGRVIVSQHGRHPLDERVWRSNNRRPETLPLVLLVDENTASASEIFAAAMQDNDRATIVGSRTFGKGLVQDVISLDDGSGLVLTSERYYAPSGRSIQRDYSDSGLYDYFRHINKGSLIDKPSFAARTLKGRIVYGGDGIKPDVEVANKKWTQMDLADYDAAFFKIRTNQIGVSKTLNAHEAQFAAAAMNEMELEKKAVLKNDIQFAAAVKILSR